MAKLTELPVVTSLEDADLIYAVDVSTDTSVGITKANFGGGLPAGTVVKEEIAKVTPTAGAFDFTIPSGYDRVYMVGSVLCDAAGSAFRYKVEMNGDSTAGNYEYQMLYGTADAFDERGSLNWNAYVGGASSDAGAWSRVDVVFEDPDNAAKLNAASTVFTTPCDPGTSGMMVGQGVTRGNTAEALTSVKFVAESGNLLGEVYLYGERTL